MDDEKPEEEKEEKGEAGLVPPTAGFGMTDVLGEFEVAQAAEVTVEANLRYLREARAEVDTLFPDMESDEVPELREAAIHQEVGSSDTADTEVVYISDDE